LKASYCPLIKGLCMGEACVAYRVAPSDLLDGLEAVCLYFDVALGPSLQPRREDLEYLLEEIEK